MNEVWLNWKAGLQKPCPFVGLNQTTELCFFMYSLGECVPLEYSSSKLQVDE
jgi:hypothetical protein